jgi:protein arginine kinase activator
MICQICKDKVATIHLKEIIKNLVTNTHMCKECFETREEEGISSAASASGKMLDSLSHQLNQNIEIVARTSKCDSCGVTDEELRANGRLGCGDCYKTFDKSLTPILSRIHGFTEHRGKSPRETSRNLDLKTELRRLQEALQKAILTENYELAAKLRDKMKHFENIAAHSGQIGEPIDNV